MDIKERIDSSTIPAPLFWGRAVVLFVFDRT
jgi:hypothetical protein